MNLEKLYQETGGDMAGAVRRLGSIAAVERFLRMFAGDDTFAMLQAAVSYTHLKLPTILLVKISFVAVS